MAAADGVRTWQEDVYRDLHQHPELSGQEHRTAAVVAERLGLAGFDVNTGVGGTAGCGTTVTAVSTLSAGFVSRPPLPVTVAVFVCRPTTVARAVSVIVRD